MKRSVSVQLPEVLDDYLDEVASLRLCSKAAVLREVLLGHARAERPDLFAKAQPAATSEPVEKLVSQS
jgi:hypothetical protein